jgi:hypothetical protein
MFSLPKTVHRSSLQYAVLAIWGLGLTVCVVLIIKGIPHLTDRQLDISELILLKQANPKIYEAVQQEDWQMLRRRLAEISQQQIFSDDEWGKDEESAKRLRAKLSRKAQQLVDNALGSQQWFEDWQSVAEALMKPEYRDKVNAANGDWIQLTRSFIPPNQLEQKEAEQQKFMLTEYEKILVALCAPWVTVMISTILFGQASLRRQRVHFSAAAVVMILSMLFLVGLTWCLWRKLHGSPEASANPSDLIDPVVAFLATLVGTTVTFIFPETESDPKPPVGSPAQAPGPN